MDLISEESVSDPEEMIINREEFNGIEEKMGEILSGLEWEVLSLYFH